MGRDATWTCPACGRRFATDDPSHTCASGGRERADEAAAPASRGGLREALRRLSDEGLLLQSDAALPSVTLELVGEPIRGSWWGHPRGHEIYAVCEALAEHPEVLGTKLVNAKVTYVHRRLWPALWWVATSRAGWQTRGLPGEAAALLRQVEREGCVRTSGKAAAELERRLLVHADSVHTESGAHAKVVETWEHWRAAARFRPRRMRLDTAEERLEAIASRWEQRAGARARLPWR